MLGVMIDCSRNSVMNCTSIKKFVDMLAQMGYDTLMLYTEDTYEVNEEPYFGHMRGRYSKKEMKDLDAYCQKQGIELVPCIQTLAHLNCIFRWNSVYGRIKDCDDILLIDEERTYELINHMFATISECFSTKKIHIGMDEAHRVGLGNHLRKHGYEERFDLINRHLHKVCKIAEQYDLKPMIWSDMFCKLALNSNNYYGTDSLEKIKERAALPQNISLVYWDYYSSDVSRYENMIKTNKAFDRPVIFAGGFWTWKGFAPDNKFSITNTKAAIKACKKNGIGDMIFTMWGDDGGECSRWAVLPSLFYTAELMRGNTDEEVIKSRFHKMTKMLFDDFMLLDKVDQLGTEQAAGISKQLLYNDPFTGLMDYRVSGEENKFFGNLKEELDTIFVSDDYRDIFDYTKALCDVLSVKSELGVQTRRLYVSDNRTELRSLAEQEYSITIERLKVFHAAYQKFWLEENKPHGFDIQDIRLGGLIQRIDSCRQRLLAYCDGTTDRIPELEEEPLMGCGGLSWAHTVTPNVISHLV